ncbi:hypothetical protein EYF80_014354 [Liparis tanakae]|uniref:Uncharacterized protein n=1 Tax=Liparis tanakae TaxID=230148 RepID=A0A4Z2IDZ0_9TELE|nr:hypothetical protein EYF80_014354 [Liparis tanakae]
MGAGRHSVARLNPVSRRAAGPLISGEMDASICQFPATLISPLTCPAEGSGAIKPSRQRRPKSEYANTRRASGFKRSFFRKPSASDRSSGFVFGVMQTEELDNVVMKTWRTVGTGTSLPVPGAV